MAEENDIIATSRSSVVAKRIGICKSCPELTRIKTCSQCGCFMPAKVRLMRSSCPLGKWKRHEVYENIPEKHLNK